ncbi:Multiple Pdz Domain Protein [Manis pentadactyla]|nr:Multiple Pdz Domain Protein [Manis pentadactyla]
MEFRAPDRTSAQNYSGSSPTLSQVQVRQDRQEPNSPVPEAMLVRSLIPCHVIGPTHRLCAGGQVGWFPAAGWTESLETAPAALGL